MNETKQAPIETLILKFEAVVSFQRDLFSLFHCLVAFTPLWHWPSSWVSVFKKSTAKKKERQVGTFNEKWFPSLLFVGFYENHISVG